MHFGGSYEHKTQEDVSILERVWLVCGRILRQQMKGCSAQGDAFNAGQQISRLQSAGKGTVGVWQESEAAEKTGCAAQFTAVHSLRAVESMAGGAVPRGGAIADGHAGRTSYQLHADTLYQARERMMISQPTSKNQGLTQNVGDLASCIRTTCIWQARG
jgi:hypothetical protein